MISGETIAGLAGRTIAFIPPNETLKNALAGKAIPGAAKLMVYEDGS